MTTQVNSPYLLSKIRPRSGVNAEIVNYLDELERILQQLYRRTGGVGDSVINTSESPITLKALAQADFKPNYYSVSSAHTTAGDEVIVTTAACTINLSNDSQDRTRVRVKLDGNHTVTVAGNAQTINGDSTMTLYLEDTLVDFVYYAELGEWVVE